MERVPYSARQLRVRREIGRLGGGISDIRLAGALELRLADTISTTAPEEQAVDARSIDWVEDPAWLIRSVDRGERVPIGYFLDGAQRSLPQFLLASFPIVEALCVAAVLQRHEDGDVTICPGTLQFAAEWIAPLRASCIEMPQLIQQLASVDIPIRDPLGDRDEPAYSAALADYGAMEQATYHAVMALRAELEQAALIEWIRRHGDGPDWIVVDGQLREPVANAIGFVKSFVRYYLSGADAAALLRIPEAHRTAAFQLIKGWQGEQITAWYLRLRDARGRDPRHGLIRIEVAAHVRESREIDAISAALLAERSPRASADDRWDSLLYPVYYLEQILKKYLDANLRPA